MSCYPPRAMSWRIREQSPRIRSWMAQGQSAADARTQTAALRRVISTGHAFLQNLRRGHYELGVDTDPKRQLLAAFTELALAI
jgi:hypothetical protein